MKKIHILSYVLILSVLVSYTLLWITFSLFTKYSEIYSLLKISTIAIPIIIAFFVFLFLNNTFSPELKTKLEEILKLKKKYHRSFFFTFIIFFNLLNIFFVHQIFSTKTVLIRSNADTSMIDIFNGQENFLGVIPENSLENVRLKKGFHQLLFSFKKQSLVKEFKLIKSIKPIEVEFEKIPSEHLKVSFEKDSKLKFVSNGLDTIKLRKLFDEKYQLGKKGFKSHKMIIDTFRISKKHSLYEEKYTQGVAKYELAMDRRTFFGKGKDNYFSDDTDYLDFIEITNKIAKKETLTYLEQAFLKKAKPVFKVNISNKSNTSVLLKSIILKVLSIEPVMGGGSRVLLPEAIYEIDVPTELGEYRFNIKINPLIINERSFGSFFLGLNSTKKTVLTNGAILYPQMYYKLEIYFDFGGLTRSNSISFEVLL